MANFIADYMTLIDLIHLAACKIFNVKPNARLIGQLKSVIVLPNISVRQN